MRPLRRFLSSESDEEEENLIVDEHCGNSSSSETIDSNDSDKTENLARLKLQLDQVDMKDLG